MCNVESVRCVATIESEGKITFRNRLKYVFLHCTGFFKVSDDATVDETKYATARHVITCSVCNKDVI